MALQSIVRADVVLLLLDVIEGVTEQDAKVARIALDRGRPLILVGNKWDAVDRVTRRPEFEKDLHRRLGFVVQAEVAEVSAKTGKGTRALLPQAAALVAAQKRQLPTSEVNRILQEAINRNAPPASGRRRARFYYATQVSDRPFTILVFMNDPELVPENYRRYLEGVFRKRVGIRSAPVRVQLRARSRGSDREGADAIRNR